MSISCWRKTLIKECVKVIITIFFFFFICTFFSDTKKLAMEKGSGMLRQDKFRPLNNKSLPNVLLVSSSPRSGSSMLGSALRALHSSSIYFYEPFFFTKSSELLKKPEGRNASRALEFLYSIYNCSITEEYFDYMIHQEPKFISYLNLDIQTCFMQRKKSCFDFSIQNLCSVSKLKIVKVIRLPLKFVRNILRKGNFKVIHLIRDIRGSYFSLRKFPSWLIKPPAICPKVHQDLQSFSELATEFPNSIVQISFDRFAQNPIQAINYLKDFIDGKKVINKYLVDPNWKYNAKQHVTFDSKDSLLQHITRTSKDNNMTIYYQDWRSKISADVLKEIESSPSCKESLVLMGHTILHSIDRVRNFSISLFE